MQPASATSVAGSAGRGLRKRGRWQDLSDRKHRQKGSRWDSKQPRKHRKKRRDSTDPQAVRKRQAFFAFAKKSRLIPSNPFAELKSGNLANRERDHFIMIRRAGLEPWPKLFHNLRATRQTKNLSPHTWSALGSATPKRSRASITFR